MIMRILVFLDGDIGDPLKHIELEPVEVPIEVPQTEPVPV